MPVRIVRATLDQYIGRTFLLPGVGDTVDFGGFQWRVQTIEAMGEGHWRISSANFVADVETV